MRNMFSFQEKRSHSLSLYKRHLSLPAGADLTLCTQTHKDSNHFSCKFRFWRQRNDFMPVTGSSYKLVINIWDSAGEPGGHHMSLPPTKSLKGLVYKYLRKVSFGARHLDEKNRLFSSSSMHHISTALPAFYYKPHVFVDFFSLLTRCV